MPAAPRKRLVPTARLAFVFLLGVLFGKQWCLQDSFLAVPGDDSEVLPTEALGSDEGAHSGGGRPNATAPPTDRGGPFLAAHYDPIENKVFADSPEISPPEPPKPLLGFIRIQKTGTTTLLHHILTNQTGPTNGCFRGTLDAHGDYPPSFSSKKIHQCQHYSFSKLTQHWMTELLPEMARANGLGTDPVYSTLRLFTVVRDPFDRLRSLFHYIRGYSPWKQTMSAEQCKYLEEGLLWNWTESLYKTRKPRTTGVPNQFHFLIGRENLTDTETAISLIWGDNPPILTLLTECFDASLLLLQERFPEFVSAKSISGYLSMDKQAKHVNQMKATREEQQEKEQLDRLRRLAREWGWADYRFYDAAVEQFRRHLTQSSLPVSVVEKCYAKLDENASN